MMEFMFPHTIPKEELEFLTTSSILWDKMILDTQQLARCINLTDLSRKYRLNRVTDCSLGAFHKVSLEMIFMVAAQLDIQTLFRYRALNTWFKTTIEQWKPFQDILQYGQNAVRAMIATNAGQLWTAPQLCAVLFTSRCELCGEHGEILQLLKLMRCCFRCLTTDTRLLAVNSIFLAHPQGLNVPNTAIEHIPRLSVLPRSDSWGISVIAPNQTIYDYTIAVKYRVENGVPAHLASNILGKRLLTHQDHIEHQKLLTSIHHIRLPQPGYHPERFTAAVHQSAKLYKQSSNKVETIHASQCKGCKLYWNYISPLHWNTHTLYTDSEIEPHIRKCTFAQLLYTRLHPPLGPYPSAKDVKDADTYTICLLRTFRKAGFHLPRHKAPSLTKSNSDFEMLPLIMLMHFARSGRNPYTKIYGNMTEPWDSYSINASGANIPPVSPLGKGVIFSRADGTVYADQTARQIAREDPMNDEYVFGDLGPDSQTSMIASMTYFTGFPSPGTTTGLSDVRKKKKQRVTKDHYADLLLGDEAAGNAQATWATSGVYSTICLFRGPVGLMDYCWRREAERVKENGGRMTEPWGLDRL